MARINNGSRAGAAGRGMVTFKRLRGLILVLSVVVVVLACAVREASGADAAEQEQLKTLSAERKKAIKRIAFSAPGLFASLLTLGLFLPVGLAGVGASSAFLIKGVRSKAKTDKKLGHLRQVMKQRRAEAEATAELARKLTEEQKASEGAVAEVAAQIDELEKQKAADQAASEGAVAMVNQKLLDELEKQKAADQAATEGAVAAIAETLLGPAQQTA